MILMVKLERIYTVPLGDAYEVPRNKRVPRAVKILRAFIARHMKADGEKIALSEALNKHLWRSSIQKPPRRVKVRLIKEEGSIHAYLADEKIEEKKKEEKKEAKKKEEAKMTEKVEEKKPEPKKEEAKPVEKVEAKKEEKPKAEEKKPETKKEEKAEEKK